MSNAIPADTSPNLSANSTARPPGVELWPADRFYWAVIEAPGIATRSDQAARPLPPGLFDDVAAQIPRPLDELHSVVIAAHEASRVIVCAIDTDTLRALPATTLRAAPRSLPDDLGLTTNLDHINLLVGPFEPRPIRRARTHRQLAFAVMLTLAAILLFVGLSRRAEHADRLTVAVKQAIADTLTNANIAAPDAAALSSDLARQRRLANIDLTTRRPPDASEALAALLAAWPSDPSAKPQSISIGPDAASIAVIVTGDPSPFVAALKAPPGWIVDEPRLAAVDKSLTRLSITMRPLPRGGAVPGGHP